MAALGLANRKYLGSKRLLAARFLDVVVRESGLPRSLLDGFTGTGAVAAEALRRGVGRVVAVDNLVCNTLILQGFAYRGKSLEGRMEELNALPGVEGYITDSFADTYFTAANCRSLDATRERIEVWYRAGDIGSDGRAYLLASLLLGADRVANTVGQYDAYLKHIGSPTKLDGRHLVDGRVHTQFRLLPLATLRGGLLEVLTGDIVALAPGVDVAAAYLDPPYNSRQYCDCYHVLENIARWEKPPVLGKTRKFPRNGLKSAFSTRRGVHAAFEALIDAVRARHLYMSYSSEGLLGAPEIESLLGRRGAVTVHRFPYPVFGSGAGVAKKREVTEYLFHLDTGGGGR